MEKKKPQILIIHGGMTFKNHREYLRFLETRDISIEKRAYWTEDYLSRKLGKDFDIIRPRMPRSENSRYSEWKIHFERHIPLLRPNLILIGISLGGTFLARYLSENRLPKKTLSVFFICPPFDNTLPGEDLVNGFRLGSDLSLIMKNSKNVHFLFSEDDGTVTLSHAEKYKAKLAEADFMILKSMNGHFRVAEFSEIVKLIKVDTKRLAKDNIVQRAKA